MKKYQVDADKFDGAKFAKKYNLDIMRDFSAVYEDGRMFVLIPDRVTLPDDPPVFEAPDTTDRDRVQSLTVKISATDLTLSEINELLRKERGL